MGLLSKAWKSVRKGAKAIYSDPLESIGGKIGGDLGDFISGIGGMTAGVIDGDFNDIKKSWDTIPDGFQYAMVIAAGYGAYSLATAPAATGAATAPVSEAVTLSATTAPPAAPLTTAAGTTTAAPSVSTAQSAAGAAGTSSGTAAGPSMLGPSTEVIPSASTAAGATTPAGTAAGSTATSAVAEETAKKAALEEAAKSPWWMPEPTKWSPEVKGAAVLGAAQALPPMFAGDPETEAERIRAAQEANAGGGFTMGAREREPGLLTRVRDSSLKGFK